MKLSDIYLIAKNVEDVLPEIAKGNGGVDERGNIIITLTLPQVEIHNIDKEIYQQVNHTMDGYEESNEVNIEVFGIDFKIVQKEILTK